MNRKTTVPTQVKTAPKRRPFKALAKLAVAGLLIISPPIFSGCGGAKTQSATKEPNKIAAPFIPKRLEGYDKYRLEKSEETKEKKETDGGLEEDVEVPVREARELAPNPFKMHPNFDCPY